MPRFDFVCTDCQSTFEHLLPAGSEPPKCLTCGSTAVQKRLTPPSVIFRGKGFYKTDSSTSSRTSTTASTPTHQNSGEKPKEDAKPETPKKSGEKPISPV